MRQQKVICVLGTFDTKETEFEFLVQQIRRLGAQALTIDVGFHADTRFVPDYPCEAVVHLAGSTIEQVRGMTRSEGIAVVIRGARQLVLRLAGEGRIHGIIGMGGSGGTTIASGVMHSLPLGFPKLIVSTLGGSSRIGRYVNGRDIIIHNSVVDVSGLNSITRRVFCTAAGAIVGAAQGAMETADTSDAPRIAVTMYGLTTPGVTAAKAYLEKQGYEVIVFHATGSGGQSMEALIREKFFVGLLDMTLPEVTAHVLNVASSNPGEGRLAGAALTGIPQVVCPGAMDMVSTTDFTQYPNRRVYCHNTTPSHFRPNAEDMRRTGRYMAQQLNQSTAPCAVYFPKGGLSMVDRPGEPMYDPQADQALLDTLKENLNLERVEFHESDLDINDEAFALMLAERLHRMIQRSHQS